MDTAPVTNAAATVDIAKALLPAFAAGFAVQQFLELVDPIYTGILSMLAPSAGSNDGTRAKKVVFSIVSFLLGLWLAKHNILVLKPLGIDISPRVDLLVSAIFISAGTEGLNSLMKFAGYKKEQKKAEAATQKANAGASYRLMSS